MKNMIDAFKRIGYKLPENYLDDCEKNFFQWKSELEKKNFNEIKKINEEIKIIEENIKKNGVEKNNLLKNEVKGKKINIEKLINNILLNKFAEEQKKFLDFKKIKNIQKLKDVGRTGGRPGKIPGKTLYPKPNGLIEAQLNSNLLMKYYDKFRPQYFQNFTPDEVCASVNTQTFYHYSSMYPFFEDAILALAAFHKPALTDDFIVYTCELETFLKESGVISQEKTRFLAFLNDNFKGESVFKSPILRVENGKIEKWIATVFNVDLGITEDGLKKIKVYLNRHIFGGIIAGKTPNNYMLYPRQLGRKLINATKGRWTVHIRALFDLIQRDLERKPSVSKDINFLFASIDYSAGFKNIDSFEVNVTRAKEFLDKAVPAINKVGLQSRSNKQRNLSGVKYEILGSQVIFSRKYK